MNGFLEILNRAEANKWCSNPRCTTCGARELRLAIRSLFTRTDVTPAEELSKMDLRSLTGNRSWTGAIRIALEELPSSEDMDHVLMSWLPQLDQHIRLADVVLFYFVRGGAAFARIEIETAREWIRACEAIALRCVDESLLESLVYVLGNEIHRHGELRSAFDRAAARSDKIRKALKRCDIIT